jgi:hypothetical protein
MWTTFIGINADTVIYYFNRCCLYEPLLAKLKRINRDPITMAELMDIAQRYTDVDPTVDSNDEYGQRRNRRPACSDSRRDDYHYDSARPRGNKRRNNNGVHTDFVANASYDQCDPKYTRRDDRGPREEHPLGKRFDVQRLLDVFCVYHNKEGKPARHTTANCFSLKQIEKARRAKEHGGGDQQKVHHKDQGKPTITGSVATSGASTPSPDRRPARQKSPRTRGGCECSRRGRPVLAQLVRAVHHVEP